MTKPTWKENASRLLSFLGGGSSSLFLSGVSIIALICLARVLGLWESVELSSLDLFLRHRLIEPIDERITLIEINEEDIQQVGTYPIPDDAMLNLVKTLQTYEPRAIGLDIFKDLPAANPAVASAEATEQNYQTLLERLRTSPEIVVIEKILPPTVAPPDDMPPENVGFADALLDRDGFVRRSLLASPSSENLEDYHLSFTLQLATKYLAEENVPISNGSRDPSAVRFGDTELFRMRAGSGGYYDQDTGDNPVVLINFRNRVEAFNSLSLTEFLEGDFPESWIKDRLVLIGMTAVSTKDYINSAAIASKNPGLIPGVELQAHAISQILSATLDGRPILRTWRSPWEYLWIVATGAVGIGLIRLKKPVSSLAIVFIGIGTLPLIISYGLLTTAGVWIPVLPAWVAYLACGSSTLIYRIHQQEQTRKIRFNERQIVLERSYNAIHNGPLQTLKCLIRESASRETAIEASIKEAKTDDMQKKPAAAPLHPLTNDLKKVDEELRSIYEFMQREYLQGEFDPSDNHIYLTKNYVMDLSEPLHELLHQVYQNKLQESADYFQAIKIKISDFCPMDADGLSNARKENILRFLEEALCNVEQHSRQVSRLSVTCKQERTAGGTISRNVIRVSDNGVPASISNENRKGSGSRQANTLAKRLRGRFVRSPQQPKGIVCELTWPATKPRHQKVLSQSVSPPKSRDLPNSAT